MLNITEFPSTPRALRGLATDPHEIRALIEQMKSLIDAAGEYLDNPKQHTTRIEFDCTLRESRAALKRVDPQWKTAKEKIDYYCRTEE